VPEVFARAEKPGSVKTSVHPWQRKARILVTCARHVPPLLKMELAELGFHAVGETETAVMTEGTLADCMRLNLWLRTAHRVHWHLASFTASAPEEFYRELSKCPWEAWISPDEYLTVASAVRNNTIKDYRYANLKCKDAICDRLRSVSGRRPNSGAEMKGVCVFVYWQDRDVSVYFDTSGEALSKRGYRRQSVEAPMQETLAAAVVLASGWKGESHFVNPMCGSGTLAIEAALLATHCAPALARTEFAFMHLKGYDPRAWERLREDAACARREWRGYSIVASDHNPAAVRIAKENAARAGVAGCMEFHICDFAATPLPESGGVIFMNPEYGERMGETQALIPVYRRIGDFLKHSGSAWRGYVFTGNPKLFNKVSLRPDRMWTFFSGGMECRLLEFRVYAGKAGEMDAARNNEKERGEEEKL
jgi:23S rRNA G2445 N2-methylase RlmL